MASSCLFLALFLFFLSPFLFFHRGLSYEKVFTSFVYLFLPFRKKITSVGKLEEKGKMGPAQDKKRIMKYALVGLILDFPDY